jgi:hypothetical protein
MKRNRISSLLFAAVSLLFLAQPAAAFEYWEQCRGGVTWGTNNVTFKPELASFPLNSSFYNSIEAARLAWNNSAPGSNWRIHHNWVQSAYQRNARDGVNSILIPTVDQWNALTNLPAGTIAVTLGRRSMCYFYGPRAYWDEMDILFNPNLWWEGSTNPTPPIYGAPYNMTITAVHEHGHALGLWEENDVLARMNGLYPLGGVIGTRNDPHPHGDDARGARNAYGTASTSRDVAGVAYRYVGNGSATEILPPPGPFDRNTYQTFQFTVDNRGTTDETIRIHFYLSPDRNVTTGFYLGAADVWLQYARSTQNAQVTLRVPNNAPTGDQYFAWVTDPHNAIYEVDEGNNAVAHVYPTTIRQNRVPEACFERNPAVGNAPMTVTFNASCTTDADGGPLTYHWDFGDGTTGTGVTTSHTYYWADYFNITLTVTDPTGASSSTLQTVSVQCSPNSPACQEPE